MRKTAVSCGSSSRFLDKQAVVASLQESGFGHLAVRSSATQKCDWIYTPGFTGARVVEMPIQVVRFESTDAAIRRYEADKPLLTGTLSARDRSGLPPGFERSRLSEERVCNVVVSSYNADGDAAFAHRYEQVVAHLRKRC